MLHLNIIKVKTPEEMGKASADEFEAVICRKPACVMGLATGSICFRPPKRLPMPAANMTSVIFSILVSFKKITRRFL